MRKAIQDKEFLYKGAKYDVENLVQTFKAEIVPMARACWCKLERCSACILWFNGDDVHNYDILEGMHGAIYGDSAGMYLCEGNGESEVCIKLAKSTSAYVDFYSSICDLHATDYSLYEETIPSYVDIYYRGNNTIEMAFVCNLSDLPEDSYESAKTIAKEMVEMLSGIKGFEKVEYFEGDEDDNIVLERKGINYFVGIKLCFNIN